MEVISCCSPWGRKESDTIGWLNNNNSGRENEKENMLLEGCAWIRYQEKSSAAGPILSLGDYAI